LAFRAASTHCWVMSSFSPPSTPKSSRAALSLLIPQPVAPNQMQDLALRLVEPLEVHMGPLLELAQVPLDGIPSFWCLSCTTPLGGVLLSTVKTLVMLFIPSCF